MAGTIRIAILAQAARAKAELASVAGSAKKVESAWSKAGARLKTGIAGGAALAGAGLAAMATQAIQGARESAQINRVFEQQLKSMAATSRSAFADGQKFAAQYGNQIGKDDDAVLSVVNKLSTFPAAFAKGSLGAQGMQRAVKAAFDLEAAGIGSAESNIIGLGKALDNPVKGLTALSKSGVSFTAQQQEQIKNYVKQGKLAQAQAVLLKGVETNAKGAATVQADGLTRAKTALDNFAEGVASQALPYLDRFGNWFTDKGIPAIQGLIDLIVKGDFTSALGNAFGISDDSQIIGTILTIRNALTVAIPAAFRTAKAAAQVFITVLSNPAFQAFAAGVLTIVAGLRIYSAVMTAIRVVTGLWAAAQAALNIVLAANPIGIAVLAIAALVAIIIVAWKRSETFRAVVLAVWGAVRGAVGRAVGFITGTLPRIWTSAVNAFKGIPGYVSGVANRVKTRLGQLPGEAKAALSRAGSILLDAGRQIVQGLINGITNKIGDLRRKASELGGIVKDAAKSVLRIKSPSRVMVAIGQLAVQGFALGLSKTKSVGKAATALAGTLVTKALAERDRLKTVYADLLKARDDFVKQVADSARGQGIGGVDLTAGLSAGRSGADTLVLTMQDRLKAIRDFASGVQSLARRGLGAGVLKQIIDGGVDSAGGLVETLRTASPQILAQIRSLDAAIGRESTRLGTVSGQVVFGTQLAGAQRAAQQPVTIRIDSAGSKLDDVLVEALRKAVRVRGGNVQLVLGGRR